MTLIDDLAFREVPARLARFYWAWSNGAASRRRMYWLIPLELGTEDIASLLGSTRQTVSQLLNQWARDGILARPVGGNCWCARARRWKICQPADRRPAPWRYSAGIPFFQRRRPMNSLLPCGCRQAAPDRYISFKDIDCDGNARRIMDCIAHHIALPERNNAFWEYFMKNAKAAPAPPG